MIKPKYPAVSKFVRLLFCATVVVFIFGCLRGSAATLTVTNTLDVNNSGSLRRVIFDANSNETDTIVFNIPANDPGCVNNVCTIVLRSPLVIGKSVNIQGNGADRLVISGDNRFSLIQITAVSGTVDVSFSGLRFSNGRGSSQGRAGVDHRGGGRLTLSDCVFSNNTDVADIGRGAAVFVDNGSLTVNNCVFRNNIATATGNGPGRGALGGAIYSLGDVTIRDSVFDNNAANGVLGARGGAIYSGGAISITNSTITNNRVTANGEAAGGGLSTSNTAILRKVNISGNSATSDSFIALGGGLSHTGLDLTLDQTTVDNNLAASNSAQPFGGGGGIFLTNTFGTEITATIRTSTISNNRLTNGSTGATFGGGIFQSSSTPNSIINLTNSTIAGNSTATTATSAGGGIHSSETINLVNVTVAGNSAVVGGGLVSNNALFSLRNTLVALNSATTFADVGGGFASDGYNLIGRRDGSTGFSGATNITGTNQSPRDPGLATDTNGAPDLANNGGPTKTVALIAGSAAIDKGASAPNVGTDQLGANRPQNDPTIPPASNGNDSDIGAFEFDQCGSSVVTNTDNSGPGSLRCAISAATDGGTVTFDPTVFATPRTINITSSISIEKSVTINGPGASRLLIAPSAQVRVFNVGVLNPAIDVTLRGMTIANGVSIESAQNPNPSGGCINYAGSGSLTIVESTVQSCRATVNSNVFPAYGGGVYASSTGTLNIQRSTIANNQATFTGGGSQAFGGGVGALGDANVNIENSTITNNVSGGGAGAVFHGLGIAFGNGKLRIIGSTLVRNTADSVGGVVGLNVDEFAAEIGSSIIALNTATASTTDASGSFTSLGNNFFGALAAVAGGGLQPSDQRGTLASPLNPDLGNLGLFSGPTPVIRPNATSPVIDRGRSFGLTTDQTGNARTIDTPNVANTALDPTDIGAFERASTTTCTTDRAEGFWATNGTWDCGFVPTSAVNVVVRSGQTVLVDVVPQATLITIKRGGTMLAGGGFVFASNIVVEDGGTLDVGSDPLFITGNTVIIAPDAIVVGSGGYIVGSIRKTFRGPTPQFTFPLGTANGYSPVELANIPGAGTLTVSATQGAHPSPGVGVGKLLRYWTVTNGSPGIVSADVTFNYLPDDVPVDTNPSEFRIIRLTGNSPEIVNGSLDQFNPRFTVPGLARFSDWTLGNIVPTAANVSVGGRIVTRGGQGISNVTVTMTDTTGATRTTRSGTFGNYRFDDVPSGAVYVVSVTGRRFSFETPSQVISVGDSAVDLNFVANGN